RGRVARVDVRQATRGDRRDLSLEEQADVFRRRPVHVTGAEEERRVHADDLEGPAGSILERLAVALERGLLREELRAIVRPAIEEADRSAVFLGRDSIWIVAHRDRAARRCNDDATDATFDTSTDDVLRPVDVELVEGLGVLGSSRHLSRAVKDAVGRAAGL